MAHKAALCLLSFSACILKYGRNIVIKSSACLTLVSRRTPKSTAQKLYTTTDFAFSKQERTCPRCLRGRVLCFAPSFGCQVTTRDGRRVSLPNNAWAGTSRSFRADLFRNRILTAYLATRSLSKRDLTATSRHRVHRHDMITAIQLRNAIYNKLSS